MAVAFRYRLLVPPVVAGLALGAGLLVARDLAARAGALTEDVRVGFVPAVEAARDLEELLARTQARLEEAAATEDAAALAAADEVHAAFSARVDALLCNRVVDLVRVRRLGEAYDRYFALARATTADLARGERGEGVTAALRRMTAGYSETKELLAADTALARARMEEAFLGARALQRTSERVTLGTSAGALLLLVFMLAGMISRLRSMNAVLRDAADRLSTAAGGLAAVTQASSARLQQQAAELVQAGATSRTVAESSAVAARQAEAVLEVARRAAEHSAAGQASAAQGLEGIERMRRDVEALVATSGGLAEKARQVVEINTSVQQLAHQSNLLSLNALIEAARAGAAGSSFAVVAREVRALADRSRAAADRIGGILEDIEHAVRTTVASTQQGQAALERSLREVVASAESLRALGRIIAETSDAATQIAGAVKHQSSGVTEIAAAVGSLDAGMGATLAGMEDVDRAAADLHVTAERIGAVVQEFRI